MERDDYVYKVLDFKEKVGMFGVGEWVCLDVKSSNRCYLSIHKKDLRPIGVIDEVELLKAISEGKIEIGKNCKFRYRPEKVGDK